MFSLLNCVPRRLNRLPLRCKPSSLYAATQMSHSKATWGYSKEDGPATWAKLLDIKVGKKQSPIDIVRASAVFDESLKSLKFSYPGFENAKLENNGHTVQFSPTGENTSEASCGPVTNKYKLAQFHFHWGENNDVGSEHTVDGKPYSGELHLVHYNTDLYSSAAEALTQKDGLMVFGIFLK
ncbi:carbonic anhydrase 7, partial [Paramuricea clavata]